MNGILRAAGVLAIALVAASAAGCGSTRSASVQPVGFLGDYSAMTAAPRNDEALVYVSRPGVLGDYDRFMLDPVLIYFRADARASAVNPDDLHELATALHDAVAAGLEDGGYAVVDEPGPGVLRLRAAITDVDAGRPAANVGAKVAGAATMGSALLVPAIDIGGAAIEAEMIDSATGERVVAFADAKKGRRFMGTVAAAQRWGHAHAAFKAWAKQLRERVDEGHAGR